MFFIDFSNKKIMIVGASSGIGRATAILLSKLGANLVLVSRKSEQLNETRALLEQAEKHIVLPFDVSNFDNYKELFDKATLNGEKLSGLVYTAGIAKALPLRIITYGDYEGVFRINYYGFLAMTKFYAKRKYNNGGSIVGVSALNAHYPQKCMTIYSASKAAIEATIRSLALELAGQQIRINSVIPGAVNSPMAKDIDRSTLDAIVAKQLLGMQTAEQIANLIVFLLSEKANAITGRNLFVDGGMLGQ